MSNISLDSELNRLYEARKEIESQIDKCLKQKLEDFMKQEKIEIGGQMLTLDDIYLCVRTDIQNCEKQKWNQRSKINLLDELNRCMMLYHDENIRKSRIPLSENCFKIPNCDYVFNSANIVVGIFNNRDESDEVRQLTMTEKKIAKGSGLKCL